MGGAGILFFNCIIVEGQIEDGQKTFYTVPSGSLQTGGAISCLLPLEEMGQEISLLQLLLPEGLVFTMKTTHTHTTESHTQCCVVPSSMMNNST